MTAPAMSTTSYNISNLAAVLPPLIGIPYKYGGTNTSGFDCSGVIQYVYEKAFGINPGRTTVDQLNNNMVVGRDQNWELDMSQIEPGDLIFYGYPGAAGPNAHVVLYLGGGKVFQAGGTNVNVTNLFQSASPDEPFLGIRRVVNFDLPAGTNAIPSIYGPPGNTSAPSQGPLPGGVLTASSSGTGDTTKSICVLKFNYTLGSFCVWQAGWSRALLGGLLIASGGIVALIALGDLAGKKLISTALPARQMRRITS